MSYCIIYKVYRAKRDLKCNTDEKNNELKINTVFSTTQDSMFECTLIEHYIGNFNVVDDMHTDFNNTLIIQNVTHWIP